MPDLILSTIIIAGIGLYSTDADRPARSAKKPITINNMTSTIWNQCIRQLESELTNQLLNTWIHPLQAEEQNDALCLYAPNRFVLDWVKDH